MNPTKFQAKLINKVKNKNALVCAPTNSGKTIVAYNWADVYNYKMREFKKTIFTSPIKALSNERYNNLKKLGVNVGLITGDVKWDINSDVLCMTQEIYAQGYYKDVANVIIDEFHYIFHNHDRARCYMESIDKTNNESKLLLMSATCYKPEQLAKYLKSLTNKKFTVAKSNERLVPLKYDFNGMDLKNITDSIIFCFSRSGIMKIVEQLKRTRNKIDKFKEKKILDLASEQRIEFMSEWIYGISRYHGKMLPKEKMFVEYLFRKNYIDVVVGTDALALGVNLPAKYVVLAQTVKPTGKKLEPSEFLQLTGRAGRFGFHDYGIATFLKNSIIENPKANIQTMFAYLATAKLEEINIRTDIDIKSLYNGRYDDEEIEYLVRYHYPIVENDTGIREKYSIEVSNLHKKILVLNEFYRKDIFFGDKVKYNLWYEIMKNYYLPEWTLEFNAIIAKEATYQFSNNGMLDFEKLIEFFKQYASEKKMILGEYLDELLLLFKWKNDIIQQNNIVIKNMDLLIAEINDIDHTIFNPDCNIEKNN